MVGDIVTRSATYKGVIVYGSIYTIACKASFTLHEFHFSVLLI